MRPCTWFLIVFLCLFCFGLRLDGQTRYPINEWIANLSVKSDPWLEKFSRVTHGICALDSIDRCNALLEMDERITSANARGRIRYAFIKNDLSKDFPACPSTSCPNLQWDIEKTKEMLRLAYEIEDPYLIAFGNKVLAFDYQYIRNYGMAVVHMRIAQEDIARLYPDHSVENPHDYYFLGENLYHTREYRDAITAFQVALNNLDNQPLLPVDTIPMQGVLLFLYNTMGLAYHKLHQYDSALIAFDKALNYAEDYPHTPWRELVQGNRGDVFFQQGVYDSAKALLTLDMNRSLTGGHDWADNAANSMQWLARIKVIEGDAAGGLEQIREADRQLKKLSNPGYQANIYYAYIQAFEKLQKADSVYAYMEKYLVLHDSLEQVAADNRAENVMLRLNNQENIFLIRDLNKEKRKVTLILYFIIAVIILLTVITLILLNRQKLMRKVRSQKEIETRHLAEQLELHTKNLIDKTRLVETLQTQLMDRDMSEEQVQQISLLSRHAILTDADWDNFKMLFEKVYPGFFFALKNKVVDLTTADQRMAAMSKLKVSNKEAATLMGIAPNSVVKAKQRLRHRLGLEPEADLEQYFAGTKEFN